MRLAVQVQNLAEQQGIVSAYTSQLGGSEKAVLSRELALTGIKGQTYQSSCFNAVGFCARTFFAPAPAFPVVWMRLSSTISRFDSTSAVLNSYDSSFSFRRAQRFWFTTRRPF